MEHQKWTLQLFAEGVTGENGSADAGQGIAGETPARAKETQDAAASSGRLTWEQIKQDPEYNREMQNMIRARLKAAQQAWEKKNVGRGLAPAAQHTPAMTAGVLQSAANLQKNDCRWQSHLYESSPRPTGSVEGRGPSGRPVPTGPGEGRGPSRTPVPTGPEEGRGRLPRRGEAPPRNDRIIGSEVALRRHYDGLVQQGEKMKQVFPGFDLQRELRNPAFTRLTAPHVGLSVEDAYYTLHRRELQGAAMQVAAQKTAEKLSNAIRAGARRPEENGTGGQAPSVAAFNYANASPAQREALKQAIRRAGMRGEKIYPTGREF